LGALVLRPLLLITSSVGQLAQGRGEVKLEVSGHDELSTLADKFNLLSKRIKSDRSQWEGERAKFYNVFRSITDAVILLDSRGLILFANAEAQGRLGLPAGGLADGKPLTLLLGRDHPLTSLISNAYTMGSEVHDVAIELKESGSTSQFLTSIFSLGQGPEPPGLLLIVRDLDPVQKLESVVDYSGRLARLGALISGVAHQIRNPLNAMNLQLELLSQDAERGASVTPRLESVRSQIRKLDQVINALLRFMRPEELRLADVPVNELVSDIGGQVGNSGIEVVYELDPEAPSARIDRGLGAGAIKNIFTKAVPAMANA